MTGPAWVPCPHCGEWLCTIHRMHVFECPCPPVDEWERSPYQTESSSTATKRVNAPKPTARKTSE